VLYVADLPASVRFYRLLGYAEQIRGEDDEWRYAYVRCAGLGLLLASGAAPEQPPTGPVTLYLQVHDADAVAAVLRDAAITPEHLGYPDHAPGGELKVVDPDGYVLLLGQVTGAPPTGYEPADDPQARASVLRRAAVAARRRGAAPAHCQVPASGGTPCQLEAEVKLADSWGDSVWACLPHGEEFMINAPAAFLANEDSEGIAGYLRRRGDRIVT
jgi:catechol 2,3-dioxygenase-like lactoylglutathione lyase family enzyme